MEACTYYCSLNRRGTVDLDFVVLETILDIDNRSPMSWSTRMMTDSFSIEIRLPIESAYWPIWWTDQISSCFDQSLINSISTHIFLGAAPFSLAMIWIEDLPSTHKLARFELLQVGFWGLRLTSFCSVILVGTLDFTQSFDFPVDWAAMVITGVATHA